MSSSIIECLQTFFAQINKQQKIWIAYSGGIDSSVLLHAAHSVATQQNIHAVHIDHQIHQDSIQWSQHCAVVCDQLNINMQTIQVDLDGRMHLGLEGAARDARYSAFTELLHSDDVLLTAHHADDQVETLLLQLLRGAGSHGLSGCAVEKKLGKAVLMRPLLNITRADIEAYANEHGLNWLEDPSNKSIQHDRNYLRHEVIPLLQKHWPQLQTTFSRAANWQRESSNLLDDLAKIDLSSADISSHKLSVDHFTALNNEHTKNALRFWMRQHQYPMPSAQILQHMISDVIDASEDREPCVSWQDCELRKYRKYLYLQKKLPEHNASRVIEWQVQQPLKLANIKLTLTSKALESFGILLMEKESLQVRFRQGGEVIRPRGRGCEKTLKTLFQEAGVPPWLRDRIPLIFQHDRLICVWGFWVAE